MNYNKNNLTEEQVEKLITDNYNLSFLDDNNTAKADQDKGRHANPYESAQKFKHARQGIKRLVAHQPSKISKSKVAKLKN